MDKLKYIEVDGEIYRLTGDYYKRHITIFLHRYIWEKHHGIIPEGFHIHHIDGNKLNNDLSNLECLSKADHHKRTWQDDKGKMREIARNNMKKAILWRSKPEAKETLSLKSKKAWLKRDFQKCTCQFCGKDFQSRMNKLAKWCSKRCCKSYHYKKGKKYDLAGQQSNSKGA